MNGYSVSRPLFARYLPDRLRAGLASKIGWFCQLNVAWHSVLSTLWGALRDRGLAFTPGPLPCIVYIIVWPGFTFILALSWLPLALPLTPRFSRVDFLRPKGSGAVSYPARYPYTARSRRGNRPSVALRGPAVRVVRVRSASYRHQYS